MPTFVKILIALAVVSVGFAVYWWMQPPAIISEPSAPTPAASIKPVDESEGLLHPGDNIWVSQYDDRGRLSYRFRAEDFVPQKNGTVRVTKPEAEFFLRGGTRRTRVRVTGVTGEVIVQATPEPTKDAGIRKEDFGPEMAQPPRRGQLNDVRIDVYDGDQVTEPAMSLAMNNAAFDNETFRIYTAGYVDPDGKEVPADRVRVEVSGNYEFVGYGLTIRWNDRDQRLELLKIAHGEKLIVKDPSLLSGAAEGTESARGNESETPVVAVAAGPASPVPPAPAEAAPAPAPFSPAAPTPAPAAHAPPPVYVASFKENVRITQGEQTLVVGDAMNVQFLLESANGLPEETTAPAPPSPAETPAEAAPESVAPPETALAEAAPAPAEPVEPVTIFWQGELVIIPSAPNPERPAMVNAPGDVAVEFVGAPLVLTQQGGEVQCASLTYRTSDGSVWIRNSDKFPRVLVKQIPQPKAGDDTPLPPPAIVSTESVEYLTGKRLATLSGRSTARIPLTAETGAHGAAEAGMLEAEWAESGTFHLLGEGQDLSVERAEFRGDVSVKHPQMALASQKLDLTFDQPAPGDTTVAAKDDSAPAAPTVRSIIATERVRCDLVGETGKQTVVCNRLELKTAIAPDGSFYPQVVDASGKVRATDEKQELSAGRVVLTLAPAKRQPAREAVAAAEGGGAPAALGGGAVDLRSLSASKGVSIRSADGATASGDSLDVVVKESDQTEVRLVGKPARVVDLEGNAIIGPEIHVFPEAGDARVLGAGSLVAVQKDKDDPTDPGRKVNIAWTDSAMVDGKKSRITVAGDVVATIPDRDGTVNTARGDTVAIVLVPKTPATDSIADKSGKKPAAKQDTPAPAKESAAAGPLAGRVKMDVFQDKQVGAIALVGEAVVNSNLKDADGALLREFQMQAPAIRFDVVKRQLVVPNAGQMLVRDHRPSNTAKDPSVVPGPGEGRGVSAFQWKKALIYDEQKRRATMKGDVLIVHKPDGENQSPVRLSADWVSAAFEPTGQTKPAAGDEPADLGAALRLTGLSAIGNINATRDAAQLTAHRIDFNPADEWITASGTARNPATFTDGAGAGSTTAEVVQWNAKTWHVRFKNITARVR